MLESPIELVQLLLSLKNSFELVISLLFLSLILLLEEFVLLFSFNSISSYNIIVVMGSFELSLHFGELMLNAVHLNTSIFSILLDLSDFFLFFTKLKIDTLMLIGQLLCQGTLESSHEWMIGWQVPDVTSIVKVLIYILIVLASWPILIHAKSTNAIRHSTHRIHVSSIGVNAQKVVIHLLIWVQPLVILLSHIWQWLLLVHSDTKLLTRILSRILAPRTKINTIHIHGWLLVWLWWQFWLPTVHISWWLLISAIWRSWLIVVFTVHFK